MHKDKLCDLKKKKHIIPLLDPKIRDNNLGISYYPVLLYQQFKPILDNFLEPPSDGSEPRKPP